LAKSQSMPKKLGCMVGAAHAGFGLVDRVEYDGA
jgi:hypothetical protein